MKIEVMEKLVDEVLLPECRKIRLSKGLAYSGTEDKLGNFKRCGKLAGVSTETAWLVYFTKHFDAICAYIRGEYSDSEPIDGRIMDSINYLLLLYAIIKEREGEKK